MGQLYRALPECNTLPWNHKGHQVHKDFLVYLVFFLCALGALRGSVLPFPNDFFSWNWIGAKNL